MITLLTDFGTRDSYVAEMKAVILRLNPQAAIVDVTHEVAPQVVAEGAVVLGRAFRVFAPDAVHVSYSERRRPLERPPRDHPPHRLRYA